MKVRPLNKKGFTLVEVILSSGIFVFIIATIYLMFLGGNRAWQKGNTYMDAQNEAARVLNTLMYDLRGAVASTVTCSGGSISFQKIEDVDGDGDVFDHYGNLEYSSVIRYSLRGNSLIREEGGNERVVASYITNFSVQAQPATDPDSITVSLTVTRTTSRGEQVSVTLTRDVALRVQD